MVRTDTCGGTCGFHADGACMWGWGQGPPLPVPVQLPDSRGVGRLHGAQDVTQSQQLPHSLPGYTCPPAGPALSPGQRPASCSGEADPGVCVCACVHVRMCLQAVCQRERETGFKSAWCGDAGRSILGCKETPCGGGDSSPVFSWFLPLVWTGGGLCPGAPCSVALPGPAWPREGNSHSPRHRQDTPLTRVMFHHPPEACAGD